MQVYICRCMHIPVDTRNRLLNIIRWIEDKMNQFIKFMLAIDAVLLIISAIIAAFYHVRFGTILIWTGFAAIIVGGMAAMGAGSVAGEYNLKLDQKMPQLN